MRAIEHSWEEYRRLVVPADAGPTQVKLTRQAFYAGVATMYSLGLFAGRTTSRKTMAWRSWPQSEAELMEFAAAGRHAVRPVGPDDVTEDNWMYRRIM